MIVVIGAGIAGLSAGYHLKEKGKDAVIFEKSSSWGGLCDNFTIEGFRFDKFIHLSFTEDEYVKKLFSSSSSHLSHRPKAYNYSEGLWLKHPVQNNMCRLPFFEKMRIIKDFIARKREEGQGDVVDYEKWLKCQFGDHFAEKFPMVYTEKYWTIPARDLSVDWIGDRVHRTSFYEMARGAFFEEKHDTYYAKEMRYPVYGGYKAFLSKLANKCDIRVNKEVVSIDPSSRKIGFFDGDEIIYDVLISSMPLPEIVNVIKNVPEDVKKAASELVTTSGALVSLGFNRADVAKHLWFYMYDHDIFPSRCYSPSLKSADNIPNGKSSLQFEVFFSKSKPLFCSGEELTEHVINSGVRMGLFARKDIIVRDLRLIPYANVVFTHNMRKARDVVQGFLEKLNIRYIGRFGEWDYLWSDQSLLSGKRAAESI